jgi:lysophospholipase L1-like esterase
VGPSDRGREESKKHFSVWERTQLVAEVQRNIAPEFGCAFWDWQQATGGVGSMIAWNHTTPRLSSPDLIHFTPQGYQVSADLFLQALDDVALHYQSKPNKRRFRWYQK